LRRNLGAGRPLLNSAAIIESGAIVAWRDKVLLPSYDVFDEERYFEPGATNTPVKLAGQRVGVLICEDLWRNAPGTGRRYHRDPAAELAERGAELILCPSASPFHQDKAGVREQIFVEEARRLELPIAVCNLVGGNTELLFDGLSCLVDDGGVRARAAGFRPDLVVTEVLAAPQSVALGPPPGSPIERTAEALVLGIRDYYSKCGVSRAILGLSGGIDSAVTAVLACAALGAENVRAVGMPTRYSSRGSITDAQELALRLGMPFELVDIDDIFASVLTSLPAEVAGSLAEENIQARARGVVLMALSNHDGGMVLAPGNKSELAVGYCTLYGDMCGALAPIGDVLKGDVYLLARLRRFEGAIPAAIIDKAPSAELRPDQTDQDSLPPYEQLDAVIRGFIEEGRGAAELTAELGAELVDSVVGLIQASEYKRKQSSPTLRVSPKAFGYGRRMPIARVWNL